MEAVYQLMAQYAKWGAMVANLRELKRDNMELSVAKIDNCILKRVNFTNWTGHLDIATGALSGGLSIFSGFCPENIGKIMDAVSKAVPQFGSTAKTYVQGYIIPVEGEQRLLESVKLPHEKDTDKTLENSLGEMNQNIQKLMQLEGQVSRNIAQAG